MDTLYETPNPDSRVYARGEDGRWLFRPKQCLSCKALFTPKRIEQFECEECMTTENNVKPVDRDVQIKRLKGRIYHYRTTGNQEKIRELQEELLGLGVTFPVPADPPETTPESVSNDVVTLPVVPDGDRVDVQDGFFRESQSILKNSGADRMLIGDGFVVLYRQGVQIHINI